MLAQFDELNDVVVLSIVVVVIYYEDDTSYKCSCLFLCHCCLVVSSYIGYILF